MADRAHHPELDADHRADRRTWLMLAAFLTVSFFVEALSDQYDHYRIGQPVIAAPWISQATSHLMIFALTPFITFMLSRFPITGDSWRKALPIHLAATVVFSAAHILSMVALRKALYLGFLGQAYEFGLADPSIWLYEYRKDVLSYTLIAAIFALNRLVEQRGLEARAAESEASSRQRLTLKSGGRVFLVDAADVIWAKAASNYVEVATPGRTYLARSTLSALEKLLSAAGGSHIRVHRSFLVHGGHISEITPTGDGNVMIRLDTGEQIPGSRGYRSRLPVAASQSGETLP